MPPLRSVKQASSSADERLRIVTVFRQEGSFPRARKIFLQLFESTAGMHILAILPENPSEYQLYSPGLPEAIQGHHGHPHQERRLAPFSFIVTLYMLG